MPRLPNAKQYFREFMLCLVFKCLKLIMVSVNKITVVGIHDGKVFLYKTVSSK